jgi:transposase
MIAPNPNSTTGQARRGTLERNREIVSRVRGGESMAAVARDVALTRSRVEQIVHRQQHQARELTAAAISRGDLTRGTTCQMCGGLAAETHHYDYAAPEHFVSLCTRCHAAADVLRQRHEAERIVGESLYNSREAARYIGVTVGTFLKYVRRYRIRHARSPERGGAAYLRAADLERARIAVVANRAPRDHCARGHRMTPDNTWTTERGRILCKACNSLAANGQVKRCARASRYVVLQALRIVGAEAVCDTHGRRLRFTLGATTFEATNGGGSPWIIRVGGDANSTARVWTASEIVDFAKRNSVAGGPLQPAPIRTPVSA